MPMGDVMVLLMMTLYCFNIRFLVFVKLATNIKMLANIEFNFGHSLALGNMVWKLKAPPLKGFSIWTAHVKLHTPQFDSTSTPSTWVKCTIKVCFNIHFM